MDQCNLKLVLVFLRLSSAFCDNGAGKLLGISKITFQSCNFINFKKEGIPEE